MPGIQYDFSGAQVLVTGGRKHEAKRIGAILDQVDRGDVAHVTDPLDRLQYPFAGACADIGAIVQDPVDGRQAYAGFLGQVFRGRSHDLSFFLAGADFSGFRVI